MHNCSFEVLSKKLVFVPCYPNFHSKKSKATPVK